MGWFAYGTARQAILDEADLIQSIKGLSDDQMVSVLLEVANYFAKDVDDFDK